MACLSLLLMLVVPVHAGEPSPGEIDARMKELGDELRCLVCQNQTLDESDADLAVSLRREIRGMMRRGASDQEIIDFLVQRYGDFVLYRPPVKRSTWLLWFGPALLLVVGGGVLVTVVVRRRRRRAAVPLSDEERQRLARILDETKGGGPS